jgi:beta-lactamase class A
MTHRFFLLSLIILFALPSHAQEIRAPHHMGLTLPDSILDKIESIFQAQKGTFELAFKDLMTGGQLFIREYRPFHAASMMKVPVLIEIYRQAALGRLSLSDSLVLKNEFTSIADSSIFHLSPEDDSELELYKHIGEKRTINDLAYQMITVSSNFATNLLIDKVKPQNVNATLQNLGVRDMQVLRGVEDNAAYQRGMNNTVTAGDLLLLFEKMANGTLVSPAASAAMIRILLDQKFNEIIPARLPAGVKVAHKTGWIKGINHDGGIVFLPDGRKYVLVLLSNDTPDDKASIAAMAAVSELLYQYVAGR